jgi:Cft2 family RNA processing exonuclease
MIDHPILENEPWLLFYTGSGRKDTTLQLLKKRYDLRVVACSGWARDNYYKYRIGADQAYIISDHCDYGSLLTIIEQCQPGKIFTIFGSAKELAKDLQKEGFNAIPLVEGQACLDHFF